MLIGVFDATIYFEECERRKCVSVNVVDNLPDPSTTFFDLSLTRTANLNPRIALQPQAQSEFYIRESVDALCRDGAGLMSRERVQRGRLTRQGTTS